MKFNLLAAFIYSINFLYAGHDCNTHLDDFSSNQIKSKYIEIVNEFKSTIVDNGNIDEFLVFKNYFEVFKKSLGHLQNIHTELEAEKLSDLITILDKIETIEMHQSIYNKETYYTLELSQDLYQSGVKRNLIDRVSNANLVKKTGRIREVPSFIELLTAWSTYPYFNLEDSHTKYATIFLEKIKQAATGNLKRSTLSDVVLYYYARYLKRNNEIDKNGNLNIKFNRTIKSRAQIYGKSFFPIMRIIYEAQLENFNPFQVKVSEMILNGNMTKNELRQPVKHYINNIIDILYPNKSFDPKFFDYKDFSSRIKNHENKYDIQILLLEILKGERLTIERLSEIIPLYDETILSDCYDFILKEMNRCILCDIPFSSIFLNEQLPVDDQVAIVALKDSDKKMGIDWKILIYNSDDGIWIDHNQIVPNKGYKHKNIGYWHPVPPSFSSKWISTKNKLPPKGQIVLGMRVNEYTKIMNSHTGDVVTSDNIKGDIRRWYLVFRTDEIPQLKIENVQSFESLSDLESNKATEKSIFYDLNSPMTFKNDDISHWIPLPDHFLSRD